MTNNYKFYDADSSILTAASSVIGSAHHPYVIIQNSVLSVSQGGTAITSIVNTVPSSVIVGASVFGNVGISGIPNVNTAGSVVAFQGTASNLKTSSSVIGTVPVTQVTDPWSVTNVGSITTANPQSSVISRYAPIASVIQGTADLRVVKGASVAFLSAQGTGIRNYIKHIQIANFGPASVLVTIADNTTSILGYTIAPAGSGSNYDCFYKSAANSPVTASINGTASVLVSAQGFTA